MKKLLPIAMLLAAALFSCENKGGDSEPTLMLDEITLSFESSGNSSKIVKVTSNVEWKVEVASTASEWLTASKTDNGATVTVTVSDNSGARRVGVITVSATAGGVSAKRITVTQEEGVAPQYSLTVEPAAMTFTGEGAEPQTATVTVNDPQLKWSAAPEDAIAGWVTVKTEGDKLTVTVGDNPDTDPRSGNVIITPDAETASKKAIRVTQEGKVLPPSIEVSRKELKFTAYREVAQSVNVTAVNADWSAEVLKEEGKDNTWIELSVLKNDNTSLFSVNVKTNPLLEERIGYIVVKPSDEELEEIRVKVIQEAAVNHLSNLTGDVELTDISEGVMNDVFFGPNQVWHDRDFASWTIELWATPNVTREKDWYGFWLYSGTGTRLYLKLRSERILYNDDGEYFLPDGEYELSDADPGLPNTIEPGGRTHNFATPTGSWYLGVNGEDNTYGDLAPIGGGKVVVTRTGDEYKLDLYLEDDAGFAITGSCVSKLDNLRVNYTERPEIKPNPNPEPNPEPEPNPGDPNEPTPY